MLNACFDVAVTSEAMDGAAPELNPGWVHRRKNSNVEARQSPIANRQSSKLSNTLTSQSPHSKHKKTADCSHNLPF